MLALAWLAIRRRLAFGLPLWAPAIWLALRLLDPVVGPAPPGTAETVGRYLQATLLAVGPPLMMLLRAPRIPPR
ncbi:MAG TPA: hypothetical protein PKA13_21875 [Geminicoccaceae bacterium]|nr:hypothetical protein [Geminicoccus sp.]HMU52443.1 hypothetical protein [Geminicoccaceae bacterium]